MRPPLKSTKCGKGCEFKTLLVQNENWVLYCVKQRQVSVIILVQRVPVMDSSVFFFRLCPVFIIFFLLKMPGPNSLLWSSYKLDLLFLSFSLRSSIWLVYLCLCVTLFVCQFILVHCVPSIHHFPSISCVSVELNTLIALLIFASALWSNGLSSSVSHRLHPLLDSSTASLPVSFGDGETRKALSKTQTSR